MKGSIINRSRRPVTVRLNTGQARYLPPHAELESILEAEVRNNAMIQKLVDRRLIELRGFSAGPKSTDLKAEDAIAHIEQTPLENLQRFVPPEEDRVTVLRAWEEKQDAS